VFQHLSADRVRPIDRARKIGEADGMRFYEVGDPPGIRALRLVERADSSSMPGWVVLDIERAAPNWRDL